MKNWWLILLLLVALTAREKDPTRIIDNLEPVKTLQVCTEPGGVSIRTDTGAAGYGTTLSAALENLHSSASAIVFLETARYLIVDETADLKQLRDWVRPACKLCLARGELDLEQAGEYLDIHDPQITMIQYWAGKRDLAIYYNREGRGQIAFGEDS